MQCIISIFLFWREGVWFMAISDGETVLGKGLDEVVWALQWMASCFAGSDAEGRDSKDHEKVTPRENTKHSLLNTICLDKFGFGCARSFPPCCKMVLFQIPLPWGISAFVKLTDLYRSNHPCAPELGALVASVEWHVVLSLLEADGPGAWYVEVFDTWEFIQ